MACSTGNLRLNQLSTRWRGVEEGRTKRGKKVGRWEKEVPCRSMRGSMRVVALEEKYLIKSCARVLKESDAELLTLVSGEEIHAFSPCPESEMCGQRDSKMVAMVWSRPVVKPSKTCLFTLRPNMDLSSSGTYSCWNSNKKNQYN